MTENEHLPVSPDELQEELYDAYGGPADPDDVAAAVEVLRSERPDLVSDGADDSAPAADVVEHVAGTEGCPLCETPVPENAMPTHLVDVHSD